MQMHALPICSEGRYFRPGRRRRPRPLLLFPVASAASPILNPTSSFLTSPRITNSTSIATTLPSSSPSSSSSGDADVDVDDDDDSDLSQLPSSSNEGIEIEIVNTGKNSRRIRSRIAILASLQTVWNILTDYEKLADFIPGLAVSQLLEKSGNFVRLFQIGQQKLAFGLNFNAKGIVDCYERDLESLPFGNRRDIEFKMIEGDFQQFKGKWSIEQYEIGRREDGDSSVGKEFDTTLSYVVDVEPKLWLPVGLIEGRLCREIKVNLSCIRVEAEKASHYIPDN